MFDIKSKFGMKNTEDSPDNCLAAEEALSITIVRKVLNKDDLLKKIRNKMLDSIKDRSNEGDTYKLFELDNRIPQEIFDSIKDTMLSLGYSVLYYDKDFMLISWKK